MSKRERRVGLRQVAQRAGVSLSTASNVFADKPGVAIAEETRNAVLAAAAELKYRPRPRQEVVQSGGIATLGLVMRKPLPLLTNPFYSHVIHGVQEVCESRGVGLMYGRVEENATSFDELPVMVQRKQVQGLLVVGYFTDDFYKLLRRIELPFVLIDHYVESLKPDSVVGDDEQGSYLATQYFIERGHTHPIPAIISGPLDHYSIHHRFLGYRKALNDYGLTYNESYVRWGDLNVTGGYTEMNALLDLPTPPTAVFCCNDETAIGAMNALRARGVSVPDECSLIGYDDIQLATYTMPPLTTIKVEKEWLGAQGMWQLMERIAHPEMPPRRTIVGVSLVERQSVKPLIASLALQSAQREQSS